MSKHEKCTAETGSFVYTRTDFARGPATVSDGIAARSSAVSTTDRQPHS